MIDIQPNPFEEKIDAMITQLGSKSAAKRREAALFLGEVAAEDAVPHLVEVYQKDKNAQVRAAAAYSLGMYRAVEQAIQAGRQDEVIKLLTKIEQGGAVGRRAPVGRTVKINIALLISLLILAVGYFMRADIEGMIFGSTRPRAEVVAGVQQSFALVKNDTRTLQSELLDVISNHPLGCVAFYNNPAPYQLDPVDARTFHDVADIVTQLNTAQASLASAKARYDAACNNGAPFGTSEAQQTFQLLLPALQSLDPLEISLAQASSIQATAAPLIAATLPPTAEPAVVTAAPVNVVTAAPTVAATVVPTLANTTPVSEATPTIPPDALAQGHPKEHLAALFDIIDQVTETRGASTLLIQYWEDVQNTGTTSGCSAVPPEVPLYNLVIAEVDFQASPDLRDAVDLIKSGLDSLRNGWTVFQFACNSRTLRDKVTSELQLAHVTADAFTAAATKLQMVQSAP